MNNRATPTILVRRPNNYFFGGSRGFVVWIDGKKVGKLRPRSVEEFSVDPGEREVSVSMDFLRSKPAVVSAAPGSRTELLIGGGGAGVFKIFLPMFLIGAFGPTLMKSIAPAATLGGTNWWLGSLIFCAVLLSLFGAYAAAAALLFRDYWAVWTLEPASATKPNSPLPLRERG